MAASDQTYRKQYTLDIVFAVSSILMLVSIVLMFAQDYFRPWKREQRAFRDVESAVAQRMALAAMPTPDEFNKKKEILDKVLDERKNNDTDKQVQKIKDETDSLRPKKERADAAYQTVKQNYDSVLSFIYLETDHHKRDTYVAEFGRLSERLKEAKAVSDDLDEQMKVLQDRLSTLQKPLLDAEAGWKKVNDRFESQVRLAVARQWTIWDSVRDFPVLDAFAAPVKIHQIVIDADSIPIDYNLASVRRIDRCMTCHQGIDRPAYTKEMLTSLLKSPTSEQEKQLADARKRLETRRDEIIKINPKDGRDIPRPSQLEMSVLSSSELTPSRVKEFCAHPRQDLFVGSNSKHPTEKFGCTSCHRGQGAGTTFNGSFHAPNTSSERAQWHKEHDYGTDTHTFLWDYPMLASRFVESSCLKCHHQVTDLYSPNNRNEAPKLLKGYNLIRENGCFGCHEIQGRKEGRQVGPDLRLEPVPPLEELTPKEVHAIFSDADTLPGTYRKVGPSLYRLAEKTNSDWVVQWLRAPREFRPDTKMPHFYGLANNDPRDPMLKDLGQENFPDVEMQAITYYLFNASNGYLADLKGVHAMSAQELDTALAGEKQLLESIVNNASAVPREKLQPYVSEDLSKVSAISSSMVKEAITKLRRKIDMRKAHPPLDFNLKADDVGNPIKGRQLFSERGCMACHSHHGTTESAQGQPKLPNGTHNPDYAPISIGQAQFGPNLSQLKAKLGKTAGDLPSARVWLRQWVSDPHVHSPRSRMPVTHLTKREAADVAEWLLAQDAADLGKDWGSKEYAVSRPDVAEYEKLARVYLKRLLPVDYMEHFLKNDLAAYLKDEKKAANVLRDLPADEQVLYKSKVDPESLKYYLGKKAVGRMGCYGCHDIPGFDAAKPIGTGLMDWGKKKSDKLAFEDVYSYVQSHFTIEDSLKDKNGKPLPLPANGKKPYEKFFSELVHEHQREGYLNQKLLDPRSYDYNRRLAWDDRSRMPQFRFARSHKKPGETEADYEARTWVEEAEAREAVMTFILGLVAEPVPVKSINQPRGDRLAEVKGRHIIDKYNCAGCHIIRPGVFEFKINKESLELLDEVYDGTSLKEVHVFPRNYNFSGKNPESPDRVTAQGLYNFAFFGQDGKPADVQFLRLSHALRYPTESGALRDLLSFSMLKVPLKNMIYPPVSAFADEDTLRAFLQDRGTFGGDFSKLLMKYLVDKGPDDRFGRGDESGNALASGPPSLIGQGERTQTAWLTSFLLNPQPIRKMAVLRMPKFNMSAEEAKALVEYFAAVSRQQNIGSEIDFPIEVIPQKQDFDSPYWQKKNQDYVKYLREKQLFEVRKKELEPFWKWYRNPSGVFQPAKSALDEAQDEFNKAEAELKKDPKDAGAQHMLNIRRTDLQRAKEVYQENSDGWKVEEARAKFGRKEADKDETLDQYLEKYAYYIDSYRLVSKAACLQCHQIGSLQTKQAEGGQGPPLGLAHERLRPVWTEQWVAGPQRFTYYTTIMPPNLANNSGNFKEWFAGSDLERVIAARDALMVLPRLETLPANRYWALSLPYLKDETKK